MVRICITAFLGWGSSGDEGILLSIMDTLGSDNQYIVCTNLPWVFAEEYRNRVSSPIEEVRQVYDVRDDYDVFLLGGGALSWGFGWRQALTAFASDKPSMNYGVGYDSHQIFHPKMRNLYREFLSQFNAITVRDEHSKSIADAIGVKSTLTMCPSINLKEEKHDCPENMIVVCPRYEDYGSNDPQLKWITSQISDDDEVLLIPFAPYNREGVPVDLDLCRILNRKIKHGQILELDGYSPRKLKYVISQSKKVISGGRYHALVWAAAHDIPFQVCPTALANYPKVKAFQDMYQKYGSEKLKKMEKENKRIFHEVLREKSA